MAQLCRLEYIEPTRWFDELIVQDDENEPVILGKLPKPVMIDYLKKLSKSRLAHKPLVTLMD